MNHGPGVIWARMRLRPTPMPSAARSRRSMRAPTKRRSAPEVAPLSAANREALDGGGAQAANRARPRGWRAGRGKAGLRVRRRLVKRQAAPSKLAVAALKVDVGEVHLGPCRRQPLPAAPAA